MSRRPGALAPLAADRCMLAADEMRGAVSRYTSAALSAGATHETVVSVLQDLVRDEVAYFHDGARTVSIVIEGDVTATVPMRAGERPWDVIASVISAVGIDWPDQPWADKWTATAGCWRAPWEKPAMSGTWYAKVTGGKPTTRKELDDRDR